MKIEKNVLVSVINHLKPALYNKEITPILGCFCFDADNNEVFTYNDLIAIKTNFNAGINGAVKGSVLQTLINTISSDEIDIQQKDNTIVIKAGKSKLKVPFFNKDEFLFKFPEIPNDLVVGFNEQHLKAIENCLLTTGTDTSHPEMMGITICIEKDCVKFYSTNGRGLTKVVVEGNPYITGHHAVDKQLILPVEFCKNIVEFSKDYKDMVLKFFLSAEENERYVLAEFGDYFLFSRLVAGYDPINFENLINEHTKNFKDNDYASITEELIQAVRRLDALNSFSTTASPVVCLFKTEGNVLNIYGISKHGNIYDTVDYDGGFDGVVAKIDINVVNTIIGNYTLFALSKQVMVTKNENSIVLVSNKVLKDEDLDLLEQVENEK